MIFPCNFCVLFPCFSVNPYFFSLLVLFIALTYDFLDVFFILSISYGQKKLHFILALPNSRILATDTPLSRKRLCENSNFKPLYNQRRIHLYR